jgi:hypothetical protein
MKDDVDDDNDEILLTFLKFHSCIVSNGVPE